MTARMITIVSFLFLTAPAPGQLPDTHGQSPTRSEVILDDFEGYAVKGLPTRWSTYVKRGDFRPVSPEMMSSDEYFEILEEDGNQFVRGTVHNQAHRILMANGEHMDWSVSEHPYLTWKWRAIDIPEGAREDKKDLNDSAAAVYVIFDRNWLGIPRIIKYVYSSTLPVGTTVSDGRLKVLVVASASQKGIGKWMTATRNIEADYRWLHGSDPPDRPIAIMLWTDSDSVPDSLAIADFDDVAISSDGLIRQ